MIATDLAELVVHGAAGVHEGLSDDGQAGITDVRLVDVEDKVRVLDDVHPEPQRQAAHDNQQT